MTTYGFQANEFIATSWGKHIARLGTPQITTEARFFEALCNHCESQARSGFMSEMRGVIDGERIEHRGISVLLPRRSDRTVGEYGARVQRELGPGREWGLVLNNTHRYSPELTADALGYFYPLVERTGYPLADYSMEIFIGEYAHTPSGIHQDIGLESFYQPIVGNKTLYFWPPDYWKRADLDLPPAFPELTPQQRRDATVISLKEGELLYWPANYWHVAETPTFAAVMGVSLINPPLPLRGQMIRKTVLEVLSGLIKSRADDGASAAASPFLPVCPGPLELAAQSVPAAMIREASVIQAAASALHDELASWWMSVCANRGARAAAPLAYSGRCADADAAVRLRDGVTLLWRVNVTGNIVAAARGLMWNSPEHPAFVELFRQVQSGRPIEVRTALAYAPESSRTSTDWTDILQLIQALIDWNILELVVQ